VRQRALDCPGREAPARAQRRAGRQELNVALLWSPGAPSCAALRRVPVERAGASTPELCDSVADRQITAPERPQKET
jgi:hypothetical protein